MTRATTITTGFLLLLSIFFFASCTHDPVAPEPVFVQVFDRGDILDLAVANNFVCFTREGEQLVVFDRIDSTFTFKSEFNSGVRHVTSIDKLNSNQVLVGIDNFGIYAYSSADDYSRYGSVSSITFFNHSKQFCVAQPGMLQYQNEWGSFYRIPGHLPFDVTSDISCMLARNNTIWLGTPTDGILKFNPQGFEDSLTAHHGQIADDSIKAMDFDNYDNLWVLTQTGINVLQNNQWKVYKNPPHLTNNNMTIVDGQIYVATNLGIFRFKKGTMVPYEALNQHLADPFIHVVELDEHNHFWLGTRKGIYVFRP